MGDLMHLNVLLADDHTLMRVGVRKILEGDPRFSSIREVCSGEEALEMLREAEIDVLVLDLTMPGLDGFDVLAEAKSIRPNLKILVLTMHPDPEYVMRAVRAGADGYLIKDSAVQELVAGIESVVAGASYYSPAVHKALSEIVRSEGPRHSLECLTERERDVLKRIAEGLTTKEIASELSISARTVESHRSNLMRKLDLKSVALLTKFAIREGLVKAR